MRPGRSEVAEPLAVAVPPGVVQAGPGTASRPPSPPLPAPPAGDLTRGAGRGQRRGAGPATVRGPGRSERGPSRRRHGHRGPGEAANVRGRQGHRRADQRRRCARWAGARALGRAGDTAGGGSPCPSAPPGAPAPLGRDAGGARRPALQPAPPVPLILAPCGSPCRRRRPPGSPPDALEPPADVPRATTSAPRLRPSGVCLRGRGGRDTRGWRRHTGALAPPPPCRPPAPPPLFPGRTCQDPVSWSSRCAEMPGTRQVPHPQAREPRSSWFAHATRRRHGSQNLRRCTPSLSSSTPAGRAGAGRRTQNSPSVWGLGGDAGWIGGGALAGVWGIFPGSDVCSLLCTGEASGPGGLLRGVGGFPTQGPGLVLSAALQCLWPGGAAAAPDLLSPHSATAHPDPCTLHPGVTSGRPEGRPLQGWAGPASFQIRKRRHISLLLSQAPGSPFLLGKQGRGGRRRPSGAQKGGVSRCPVLPCTGALLQFAPSPLGLARLAVGGGSWRKGSGPQGCCRPGQVGHVRAEPV